MSSADKWAVTLMHNVTVGCCGEPPIVNKLTSFEFDSYESASTFYSENVNKYNKRYQLGQWLKEPEKILDNHA
jgi:hypothetical protein